MPQCLACLKGSLIHPSEFFPDTETYIIYLHFSQCREQTVHNIKYNHTNGQASQWSHRLVKKQTNSMTSFKSIFLSRGRSRDGLKPHCSEWHLDFLLPQEDLPKRVLINTYICTDVDGEYLVCHGNNVWHHDQSLYSHLKYKHKGTAPWKRRVILVQLTDPSTIPDT